MASRHGESRTIGEKEQPASLPAGRRVTLSLTRPTFTPGSELDPLIRVAQVEVLPAGARAQAEHQLVHRVAPAGVRALRVRVPGFPTACTVPRLVLWLNLTPVSPA